MVHQAKKIAPVIDKLRKAINKDEIKSRFGERIDPSKIKLFERAFGVVLPRSFKTFLSEFNGGFIYDEEADWYWMNDGYDEAMRHCTRILSIEEIIDEYETMDLDKWKLNPEIDGLYPYIPFCITDDGEKLVFVDNSMPLESGVYYAIHDEPAKDWMLVAHDFTDFLIHYIKSDGKIPTDDVDPTLTAESYLWTKNMEWRKEKAEAPEEIIIRSTANLELYPKNAFTYTVRANAYFDSKQYQQALVDFNKSIEMDPKSAFAYYCRGEMLLNLKKARQALIDLDSACQLCPDDTFYLVSRASAFYALNKMELALADCNRAIEIDEKYDVAYMVRYNIYLYLGEATKAEADSKKIDELKAED